MTWNLCGEDGTKYTGEWKNDKPDGYGVESYTGEDSEQGYWMDGKPRQKDTFERPGYWVNGSYAGEEEP